MYESSGREEAWPSLLHNANSSQLRIVLKGVMPRTNQSHFALELQTVSEVELQTRVDIHRSIDDEYTPSIFQVGVDAKLIYILLYNIVSKLDIHNPSFSGVRVGVVS